VIFRTEIVLIVVIFCTEIFITVFIFRRGDGTSRREVVVSLRSDPSVSTSFTVIFLNKVAGVSAQFVSNYGFIEVDFNQPVNGRLLGEAGATSCALFIEEIDLIRIGHDVTKSDELRLCTWLSSRRMQVLKYPY
jgi:hypothetical protein